MSAETYRNAIKEPKDHLILGLDDMTWDEANSTMSRTKPYIGMAKINSLADKEGWRSAVESISSLGMLTVADAMLHNTPKAVGAHAQNITETGAAFITVHASGGPAMLEQAVAGRDRGRDNIDNIFMRSKKHLIGGLLGATVLTSLDNGDCVSVFGDSPDEKVLQFARMARDSGLDGVLCSAHELNVIREDPDLRDLLVAVGSITPAWSKVPVDQKRTARPAEAIQRGADYLMLGRNVTRADDRRVAESAAREILDEVTQTKQELTTANI